MFERDLGSMSGIVSGPADSVDRVLKAFFADRKLTMKEEDPIDLQLGVKRLRPGPPVRENTDFPLSLVW